ncbi:MAG TPA: hypothetical protein VMU05_16500 [Dongiaceae bacterium]|nr:hypothetical protein [Dongiaceae bacterium]
MYVKATLVTIFAVLISPTLFSQSSAKSHEECLKLVPGEWGPNFGVQWRANEARYWACRLGEQPDTVRAWQKAADVDGFMQDVLIAHIDGDSVVLIEEIQGTANCHIFTALMQSSDTWHRVWSGPERLPGDEEGKYCTGPAGAIKLHARGKDLTLETPDCADASTQPARGCKHVTWRIERFHWDGQTFVSTPARK